MNRRISDMVKRAVVLAACTAVFAPGEVVLAQGGDGFLFKEPHVTLKFESGYGFQRASSDIYDFLTDELTLNQRDFDAPYFGGEFAARITERLDLAISVGYQGASQRSEFIDYYEPIGDAEVPITQVTEFHLVPATASLRYFPFERGRTIGRFAWVPRSLAPFVGGGVGFVSHSLRQYGDFVDFETLEIFTDDFESEGRSFLARASAGVNISLGQQFLFTLEGRYGWSSADLDGDFIGFEPIDLDGAQLIGGIAVRF